MIELFEQSIETTNRQSSKGNQLKWNNNSIWYKADGNGYEGLSEFIISSLLKYSTLQELEFVQYSTEEIVYKKKKMLGCKSNNFLPDGWALITLERLFKNYFGKSLNSAIYGVQGNRNRIKLIVDQTERITGLKNFDVYLSKLITIDTFFLNEDRHTHNIGVLLDPQGCYQYCPIFDNGAGLLSDTTYDYPLEESIFKLIKESHPKTFCQDYDEQLDAIEEYVSEQIRFHFTKQDVAKLLDMDHLYPKVLKDRVMQVIFYQIDKYQYLFNK